MVFVVGVRIYRKTIERNKMHLYVFEFVYNIHAKETKKSKKICHFIYNVVVVVAVVV